MSGSVVPERVHRWAGDTGWAGDVHAGAVGQTDSVAGGAGSGFGEVPGSGEGTGGAGADSGSSVSAQRAKRRYCQRIPRKQRGVWDRIVFIGVAQEKAKAFSGTKVNGQFRFNRDKTVYVNHYYFYIDDDDFGPLFIKVCSYAPWGIKLCINGHEWAKRQLEKRKIGYEALDNGFPFLRRARKASADLRFIGTGANRAAVPEMAEAHSAAVAAGRPAGRLRMGSVDLADGSEPDADLRPASARPGVLRRDHPRQSGSRGVQTACSWSSTV